jgi:hypothetical protein
MHCLNCSQFKSPTDYFYAGLSVTPAACPSVAAVGLPGAELPDQGIRFFHFLGRKSVSGARTGPASWPSREDGLGFLMIHVIRLHRWFL